MVPWPAEQEPLDEAANESPVGIDQATEKTRDRVLLPHPAEPRIGLGREFRVAKAVRGSLPIAIRVLGERIPLQEINRLMTIQAQGGMEPVIAGKQLPNRAPF